MGDRSAERAAHEDRQGAGMFVEGGQDMAQGAFNNTAFKVDMPGKGRDPKPSCSNSRSLRMGNAVDVDEVCRAGKARRHGRHEALAAGNDPCVGPVNSQEVKRLIDGCRSVIVERCGPQSALSGSRIKHNEECVNRGACGASAKRAAGRPHQGLFTDFCRPRENSVWNGLMVCG